MALGGEILQSFKMRRVVARSTLLNVQPLMAWNLHWRRFRPLLNVWSVRIVILGKDEVWWCSYICNNLIFVSEWSLAVENQSNVYYHYSPEYPLHVCLTPSVCLRFSRLRRGNLKISQRAGWWYHITPSYCHTTTSTGGFFSTSFIQFQHSNPT